MKTLEEIRAFFAADQFATKQGMWIEAVEEGLAVCSVHLEEKHMNAVGHAQGGMIFTLADFAFAVATNHQVATTVTLDATIHYLNPPKGKQLTATARRVQQNRTICLYDVEIADEAGLTVAKASMTGYIRRTKPAQ